MSTTSTLTAVDDAASFNDVMSQSVSSAGSSRRHSRFSKPFKQASQYFLTRRFSDALSAISPLITGINFDRDEEAERIGKHSAPVAGADRKWRVKIWSFYITLQNAILELGAEEGKRAVGIHEWNSALEKARNGTIWDQVVNTGYQGDETQVDAEVVLNLANLLLAQSPDQSRNQEYIETYLSVASEPFSETETPMDLGVSADGELEDGGRRFNRPSLLRSLEVQLEVIELFALHVLPRNKEWQYAREFLEMNALLDEERREKLLQALEDMKGEVQGGSDFSASRTSSLGGDGGHSFAILNEKLGRNDSNVTVIPASMGKRKEEAEKSVEVLEGEELGGNHSLRPLSPRPEEPFSHTISQPPTATKDLGTAARIRADHTQDNALHRFLNLYTFVSRAISGMGLRIAHNPAPLLRFVLFLIALIGLLGRANLREKLKRLTQRSLHSVRHTLGMGFKASSI